MNLIKVNDEELTRMKSEKGDNFEWGSFSGTGEDLSLISSNIGGKQSSYLGFKNSPIMLQCLKCRSHFLLGVCPSCETNGLKYIQRPPDYIEWYFRCSHCGFDSSSAWTCPQCSTHNVFMKADPYVNTVYGLKKKGGCFIATACYGTNTAPDVLTLRAFRDHVLLSSKTGRAFVHIYYLTSPPIAKMIESHCFFRSAVRHLFVKPLANICRSKMKNLSEQKHDDTER